MQNNRDTMLAPQTHEYGSWSPDNILTHCGLMTPYVDTNLGQTLIFGTICRRRSGSTLVQVMVDYPMGPSYYLTQCWLINSEILWHPLSQRIFKISILERVWKLFIQVYLRGLHLLRLLPHIPGTNDTLVTLGRLTDVSLNKNGGSREVAFGSKESELEVHSWQGGR